MLFGLTLLDAKKSAYQLAERNYIKHSQNTEMAGKAQTSSFRKLHPVEQGVISTVVICMAAGGNFIPPFIMFPRKRMKGTSIVRVDAIGHFYMMV